MLKISLLEFFLRAVPEAFLLILGTYILCYKKVNKRKYIISSIAFAACIYLIRMLPIHFGIHTFISMVAYIIISFKINKIALNKAISYCLILTIMMGICEVANIFIIEKLISENIQLILNSRMSKIMLFIPSIFMFTIDIFLLYIFVNKIKNKLRNESKSSI